MNTNLRRNVSAALILTPAALLAACSSSDSWHSTRSDTTDSRYDYNGTSRNDIAFKSRSYRAADGRIVYTDGTYDPYGDGVSGGPGTRGFNHDRTDLAYTTRTNEQNNPNWRDGPTRFDNDNPSNDNSSSQYNTGITRNQSPTEGTLNNQNLAKGTVQPQYENQARYQEQRPYQNQPTYIDNTNREWDSDARTAQLEKQKREREESARLNRQDQMNTTGQLANQNPSRDNSSSQYNTGISRNSSPNEGIVNNQNIAKGTAQSGYRTADGRWVNAPQGNTQGWYSRNEAARNQGDPSTNPSNSNTQHGQQNWQNDQRFADSDNSGRYSDQTRYSNQNWNQNNQQLPPRVRDENGNWVERTFDTTNMTTLDQQAAARQISDPATNPTNSNAQFNQADGQYALSNKDYGRRTDPAQNPTYSNQTTASTSRAPSNGVEPLGPQNNWGADRSQNNTNVLGSDPATNPTKSNTQAGQQNVAGRQMQPNQPAQNSRTADLNAAGQPQVYASNATADQRILSLLHFKNQKEIELGQLAATNGSSAAVKDYGNMLVREHTAADAKVMRVASQTGTTLMSSAETQNMMRAEKAAMSKDVMDNDREKRTDDSQVKDPIDELRGLNGADFDKAFAQKMVKGHAKLASAIERAKPQVRNESTRQLLNELLPTVQMHERMARELPGYGATSNAR